MSERRNRGRRRGRRRKGLFGMIDRLEDVRDGRRGDGIRLFGINRKEFKTTIAGDNMTKRFANVGPKRRSPFRSIAHHKVHQTGESDRSKTLVFLKDARRKEDEIIVCKKEDVIKEKGETFDEMSESVETCCDKPFVVILKDDVIREESNTVKDGKKDGMKDEIPKSFCKV